MSRDMRAGAVVRLCTVEEMIEVELSIPRRGNCLLKMTWISYFVRKLYHLAVTSVSGVI